MNILEIREFLGWCTLINSAILLMSTLVFALFKEQISIIHSKTFGVDSGELRKTYVNFLAIYKLLIIVFNLVPYLAIALIG